MFGAAEPRCSQLQQDEGLPVHAFTGSGYGSRVALQVFTGYACLGNEVTSLTYKLQKNNSPTGTCYARIWSSGNVLQCTLGSLDVSTISTSATDYEFDDPDSSYTCSNGDYIGIEYNSGDNTDYIKFYVHNSVAVAYAGQASYHTSWSSTSMTRSIYYIQP